MTTTAELLVVAGEPSGDRFAAEVLDELDVRAFGIGGPLLVERGLDVTTPATELAVMGIFGAASRLHRVAAAYRRLEAQVRRERPAVALLVGFSEFNARMGRFLRASGTRVLWYSPPQVWAWRPGRAARLAQSADVLATILPFESEVWAQAGVRVHHVGHPSFQRDVAPRTIVGRNHPPRVVLLPGSRTSEIRRHLPVMLETLRRPELSDVRASLVLAHGIEPKVAAWVESMGRKPCEVVAWSPEVLRGFDVALAASGTVTADCVAAGVPPVTVFRTDPITFAIARRLVRVSHVALPNLALGRRAFPELLQRDFNPRDAAQALMGVLADAERAARDVADVHRRLAPSRASSAAHVAELLRELWASCGQPRRITRTAEPAAPPSAATPGRRRAPGSVW